jgi:hypothetical protein
MAKEAGEWKADYLYLFHQQVERPAALNLNLFNLFLRDNFGRTMAGDQTQIKVTTKTINSFLMDISGKYIKGKYVKVCHTILVYLGRRNQECLETILFLDCFILL